MKESNIPWIGAIPSHWKILNTSALFHEHKLKNTGLLCTNLLSLSYGNIKRKDINTASGLLPESYDSYNVISPGDIVFRLTDLQNDQRSLRTGLCKEQGIITSAYLTLRKSTNLCERYYRYLFHTYDICKVFYGMGDGVRQGMGWKDIKGLMIFCPPMSEQVKIADYLDSKCDDIDFLIEQTKKSIVEYQTLKQSITYKVVTNGCGRFEHDKAYDLGWITKIPNNWGIGLLSQYARPRKNRNTGMIENNLLSLSYGKVIKKNIASSFGLIPESFEGYNIIEADDIVLRLTDLQNDQKSLRVGISNQRGIITSAYLSLRLSERKYAQYIYYYLHTFDICKGFYGMGAGIRQGLNWDQLKSLKICIPPMDEQQEIASYLNNILPKIDALITSKEQLIIELLAYRNSLIYEYITGKKEVIA